MTDTENRQPAFVRQNVNISRLAELMAKEKGVKVTYIDALTIAAQKEIKRLERKQARKTERQAA